jgi:hypothetical protein
MDSISNHWKSTTESISGKLQDIPNFLNWPEIRETMVFTDATIHQQEKSFIQAHSKHNWENVVNNQEATINSIHQLFHLSTFETMKNCSIQDYSSVIEFGAGYGEQCRIIKSIKPDMNYYIIDLPLLHILQSHYLSKHNIQSVHQISIDELPEITNKTIFLAFWSISEVPVELRDVIFRYLVKHKIDFFIAYQNSYEQYNNDWYFSHLSCPGYKITKKQMEGGMCANWYVIGEAL